MRPSRRAPDELRAVSLERGVVKYAEGSCMVKFGDTHVLVTATLEERLPPWLKGQGRGWVTAEYGMLPRATLERTRREASAGKQNGRTVEIQRLIGRSFRSEGPGPRLGHGGIWHAAARHAGTHPPRGFRRQAEWPHRRNPAPDRPLLPIGRARAAAGSRRNMACCRAPRWNAPAARLPPASRMAAPSKSSA